MCVCVYVCVCVCVCVGGGGGYLLKPSPFRPRLQHKSQGSVIPINNQEFAIFCISKCWLNVIMAIYSKMIY